MLALKIVLDNRWFDGESIRATATSCRYLYRISKLARDRLTWITLNDDKEFRDWHRKMKPTHDLLKKTCLALVCAREGQSLITNCCLPLCWDPLWRGLYSKFDVEGKIRKWTQDGCPMEEYVEADKEHECEHISRYHGFLNCNTHPSLQFQHSQINGWAVSTHLSRKLTHWSTRIVVMEINCITVAMNTLTINSIICPCHHCFTYKQPPHSECVCPKCSDPISGHDYVTKSGYPY